MSMLGLDDLLSELDVLGLPESVFFGDVVYKPGGTYGPRLQSMYQLLFVQSGHVSVEVDQQTHELGKGEMALLKPGHHEFFRFDKDVRTHHRWCHFSWQLSEKAAHSVDALAFKASLSQRMEHLVDLGLSLQHDPYALAPSLGHLAAAAFWEFVGAQASRLLPDRCATLPIAVARVQTYIFQHYSADLSLQSLAAEASTSPEHLSRLFRKHLHTTPMQYVWQVRVEQGLLNLRHTGLTVEEIAYRCGFKTSAHFSRRIKAECGQTPSQVRERHWRHDTYAIRKDVTTPVRAEPVRRP